LDLLYAAWLGRKIQSCRWLDCAPPPYQRKTVLVGSLLIGEEVSGKEATLMAKMRVLSARGDTIVEWDGRKVQTGDAEALAAVREAERIFSEQRARGATAFKVAPDRPAERINEFDRTAEQIVVVPRVAGG
jgi:hypothetical protein